MAKFPTDVDESVTIAAPRERVYAYFWDAVGSSRSVPDLATCERVGPDSYRFISRERSAGPVSMVARYTARYEGNGVDRIHFESLPVEDDNTDVSGTIVFEGTAENGTRVRLTQTIAPDTPGAPPRAGCDSVLRAARSGRLRARLPRQRQAGSGEGVTGPVRDMAAGGIDGRAELIPPARARAAARADRRRGPVTGRLR